MAARGSEFIGTMAVQERHRFDEAGLQRFMQQQVEGFRPPLKVEQFRGGQSNPTYKLTDGNGTQYVLRRKPPGKLLPSAHAVDREFRIISALYPTRVPVARPYALCEDEAVIGTAFYIMAFVDGRVLWDPTLPGVPKEGRRKVYEAEIDVIAELHSVDYKAVGLEDYGRPGNYVARQLSRWGKQYKASETERIEEMEKLLEWLPANAPQVEATTIVHGDYRLDNVIFHPSEPRVLAVIDWEISTLGDPLADFSYVMMTWRVPKEQGGLAGHDLEALGIPSEQALIERYCARTGRRSIGNWQFYMAYNLWRSACIRQGVYARSLDGTASNQTAGQLGKMVRPTAQQAWRVVQEIAGAG
ncbi:MAG: phosphotransferase family protein [Reyranellaceae bacterium]